MKLPQADFQHRRDRLAEKWVLTVLQLLQRVRRCTVIVMRIINSVPIVVFLFDGLLLSLKQLQLLKPLRM